MHTVSDLMRWLRSLKEWDIVRKCCWIDNKSEVSEIGFKSTPPSQLAIVHISPPTGSIHRTSYKYPYLKPEVSTTSFPFSSPRSSPAKPSLGRLFPRKFIASRIISSGIVSGGMTSPRKISMTIVPSLTSGRTSSRRMALIARVSNRVFPSTNQTFNSLHQKTGHAEQEYDRQRNPSNDCEAKADDCACAKSAVNDCAGVSRCCGVSDRYGCMDDCRAASGPLGVDDRRGSMYDVSGSICMISERKNVGCSCNWMLASKDCA